MTNYEKLLITASKKGITVLELDLGTDKKCGKLLDDFIIINRNMTETYKREILAEEIGHYNTSYGHISNQNNIINRKQELNARRNGYKYLADPHDVIDAIKSGVHDMYSLAEYFFISIELLADIIEDWKKQYGLGVSLGEYYLQLNPQINLLKTCS